MEQLNDLRKRFGAGHLGLSHFPIEDHIATIRQLELLGEKVFPPLRDLASSD